MAVIASQYVQGAERLALYGESIVAAKKAVALAPRLADAHSALGYALFTGRLDVRAARTPYDRSRELGNGDADVLGRYALYSARTGRFADARTAISRAATLDPLNPRVFRSVGAVEYAADRAKVRHETLGVSADGEAWRFWRRSAEGRWSALSADPALASRVLPPPLRALPHAYAGGPLRPDAIVPLRASGRNEPFTFVLANERYQAVVSADPLGRVSVGNAEPFAP
jgi:tetratricopeptide (TPR) repeat protein